MSARGLFAILPILFTLFFVAPARSAQAEPEGLPPSKDDPVVELSLPDAARTGEAVRLLITFMPEELPPSGYKDIRLTWVGRPDGPEPEVRIGAPETGITFAAPGLYILDVEVRLLFNSGCGGSDFTRLAARRMEINVE